MQIRNSDIVADILAERRKNNATIFTIPATPAAIRHQSVPETIEAPAAVPISEGDFKALLDKLMPGISEAVTTALAAYRERRLNLTTAVALGTTLVGIVSLAVKEGAPLIEGQSARVLVILIFGVLFDTYLAALLPLWLRPFAPLVKASVIKGLEALYQAVVKKAAT